MAVALTQIQVVVDLLRQTTSLAVVSKFLRSKNVRYSAGSWEDMQNNRIIPALESHAITYIDLVNLLRSAEECGRQHVFLYKCDEQRAIELMDRNRVGGILTSKGLEGLLIEPQILERPPVPQIVDVRWESANVDLQLCIKEIELRTFVKFLGVEEHGDNTHRIYGNVKERAVNFAKLHRDGFLEIRMASLTNSNRYESSIHRFWHNLGLLLPTNEFHEISLLNAKSRLWTERGTLTDLIRYTDTTLRDEEGNVLRAATGSEQSDLTNNRVVAQSLDFMLEHDENSYCDGTNFWFKKNDALSVDVHVLLTGEPNEFALPANCSEEDYKYVLNHLKSFNRRVS